MVKVNTEEVVTKELNKKADASHNEEKDAVMKKRAAGSDTVTVACGIPMGLRLNLSDGEVLLSGIPMSHIVSAVKGVGYLPAGKFGLTVLKASQWEEILAKYGRHDFIVNGTVFATDSHEETVEKAVEKSGKDLENNLGFDQADPKKSPRTRKKKNED